MITFDVGDSWHSWENPTALCCHSEHREEPKANSRRHGLNINPKGHPAKDNDENWRHESLNEVISDFPLQCESHIDACKGPCKKTIPGNWFTNAVNLSIIFMTNKDRFPFKKIGNYFEYKKCKEEMSWRVVEIKNKSIKGINFVLLTNKLAEKLDTCSSIVKYLSLPVMYAKVQLPVFTLFLLIVNSGSVMWSRIWTVETFAHLNNKSFVVKASAKRKLKLKSYM